MGRNGHFDAIEERFQVFARSCSAPSLASPCARTSAALTEGSCRCRQPGRPFPLLQIAMFTVVLQGKTKCPEALRNGDGNFVVTKS